MQIKFRNYLNIFILAHLLLLNETKSQSFILELLYTSDTLMTDISVDSVKTSFIPSSYIVENKFFNPRFHRTPQMRAMHYYKDNMLIRSEQQLDKKKKKTTYYLYNQKRKPVDYVFEDVIPIKIHFEYDSLDRPELIFLIKGDTTYLHEIATYTDSTVQITRFNFNREILVKSEHPFIADQNLHILESSMSDAGNKRIVYTNSIFNPIYKIKTIFKLDAHKNWIVKDDYEIRENRHIHLAKTKRKIYYTP